MVKSNESDKQTSSKEIQTTHSKSNPPPSKKRPMFVFSLVISTIALLLAGWAITSMKMAQKELKRAQDIDSAKLAKLIENHSLNKAQISTKLDQFHQIQAKTSERLDVVDKSTRAALSERFFNTHDWLLIKARYYLQIAQVNAHWSDNQEATLALLQSADSLLVSLHDPRLFKVRQAIAREMSDIRALPKIDTAGILSQIDSLQVNVSKLPLKNQIPPINPQGQAEKKATPYPTGWKEKLKDSVSLLERVVVIRHHDETIKPLVSEQTESFIRQQLTFCLQQVQWAAMQKNQAVYELALNQTLTLLKQYFDPHSAVTGEWVKEIDSLKSKSITETKPKIDESLSLLNQIIEENQKVKHNTTPKERTPHV